MSKKEEIVKQAGFYSTASFLTLAIGIIGSILSKRFLGPTQIGIWATLQIILIYSKYITLGTTTALNIEIPYQMGKKDEGTANKIKDMVFSFIMATSVIAALCVLGYAYLFRSGLSKELFYGLIFVSVIIVLQRVNNLFISLLRAYKQFYIAGRQMVLSAIVNVFLVGVLSYFFKIYGFMWATGLSLIFNIVYIYCYKRYTFKFAFEWRKLKKLIFLGVPLTGLGMMGELFRTIDRIMIISMLGFKFMGFYSIAIMVCNYLGGMHTSVAVVLMPHFQEKFGAGDDKKDLRKYLSQSTIAFSDFFPILIGFSWICAPFFVRLFLREYVDGILALKFLVPGVYFAALGNLYGSYFVTIRKHLWMFPIMSGSCILSIILNYALIKAGYGIVGVAIATTLSLAFNFTVIYFTAALTIFSLAEVIRDYVIVMSKFLFMASVLILLNRFAMVDEFSVLNVLGCAVIYGILYTPSLFKLNREFDVLKNIKQKLLKSNKK